MNNTHAWVTEENGFTRNWDDNREEQWGNRSIDKISLTVRKSVMNSKLFRVNKMRSVSLSDNGQYYVNIDIQSEHFNNDESVLLQIVRVISKLFDYDNPFIKKERRVGIYLPKELERMLFAVSVSELEVAFDLMHYQLDFEVLDELCKQGVLRKYQNTYYSTESTKATKKSCIAIYNRDLRLNGDFIGRAPRYRIEFRLTGTWLNRISNGKNKKLLNFDLFCLKPMQIVRDLSLYLRAVRFVLGIPGEIIKSYYNHDQLRFIFSDEEPLVYTGSTLSFSKEEGDMTNTILECGMTRTDVVLAYECILTKGDKKAFADSIGVHQRNIQRWREMMKRNDSKIFGKKSRTYKPTVLDSKISQISKDQSLKIVDLENQIKIEKDKSNILTAALMNQENKAKQGLCDSFIALYCLMHNSYEQRGYILEEEPTMLSPYSRLYRNFYVPDDFPCLD